MTKSPSSLRTASAAAVAAAILILPAPALAGWERIETVGPARTKDQCDTVAALRASDNRPLRLAAGSTFEIEVLGHGIDLVNSEAITFDGGDVQLIKRHGGPENLTRKCGAIGSVKLRLTINRASPESGAPVERNHILQIGDERIRVTAMLPGDFRSFGWDRQSYSQGSGSSAGASGSSIGASTPITVGSGQPCAGSQSCGGGGTTGVMIPPQVSGGGGTAASELSTHLRGCIAARGGHVRLIDDRLEILLPDDRNTVSNCITNATFARVAQFYPHPLDVSASLAPQIPAMRYSLRGAQGATARPGSDPQTVRFALTRDFAMSAVGVHDFELIATSFAGRQRKLDVQVRSVVPYGVTRIAPVTSLTVPITANVGLIERETSGRVVPTIDFDIDLAPSDASARPLVWSIQGGNGCFTQTSGRLTPAPGESRIRLTVPRTSATACNGSNIGITIAPESRASAALYTASASVTLR
ncbi:MAG: hypothetical protein OHK0018_07120 [Erythrobacter tepidarius]